MPIHPILNPPPPWLQFSTHVELWHGCLQTHARSIQSHGVDPARGDPATDFGRGFYTTTVVRQAREWARKRYVDAAAKPGRRPSPPVVIRFRVPLADLASLHSLHFVLGDYDNERFWSLVHHCRTSPPKPAAPHDHLYPNPDPAWAGWYDIVTGPVAAFWEQRVAMAGADQVSFHTKAAADVLNALIGKPDFRIDPMPTPGPGVPP